MSESIEVGEYIKTPYHKIEKINKITKEDGWTCVTTDKSSYELQWLKNNKVKHSKNIINLIEAGDYVNKRLVLQEDYKNKNVCWLIPISDTKANTNIMWYGYEDIKTICTKEQLKAIEYNVN